MAGSNDDVRRQLHNTSITSSDPRQYGSLKILKTEFADLIKDPPEGFIVEPDQNDFSTWRVGIFGPPDTLFAGGYYKAILKFPFDYPYRPPTLKFLSDMWHPNVYPDGHICISILHEPGEDERSGEKACERWSVAQNVRSILLSIISMLNEPNTSSPANIDASVEYRKYKEDPINHPAYKEKLEYNDISYKILIFLFSS
jgi:ubiquitin-conjugating enzyme E2 R